VEFFDPTVATLRRGGSATLLGAGTAAIAASMGGQKASMVLTVTVAVSPVFTAQPVNTNVSAVIDAGGVRGAVAGQCGGSFARPENYRGNRHQPAGNGDAYRHPEANHRLGWDRDVSRSQDRRLGARSMVHPEDGKAAATGRAA